MPNTVQEIVNRFSQLGIELSEKEIEERLQKLTSEFKVPIGEAKRSVVNYFLKEHDIDRSQYYAGSTNDITAIQDINQEGRWVTLKVKVIQLWEANHESIVQVGLVGDETGIIKFTMFQGVTIPEPLEEGKSYLIKTAVTGVWQGKYQINMNKATSITEIEEDVEVGRQTAEFTGVIVDVQTGSGLIKRCPECNRALSKGVCTEHGKVEGVYDLRIKAVIDDGKTTQEAIINKELSEKLTNITLVEAKDMATEALDHNIVTDRIKSKIIGRYYTIVGTKIDRYLIVSEIKALPKITKEAVDELLSQLHTTQTEGSTTHSTLDCVAIEQSKNTNEEAL
ncbi:MAG: replication factor A1 [Candidatus Argoarchaeum ethanivorans]|uniref:Replication factor A1 n=1 Tax=Candidatus Argoarchaeum ethanivorans TaxID=2608793 RepID=A0A8B3S081_9EURY|nr:MAG: replication factor A1 [Candidatus Argoarchaeum ethanivorans]